MNFVEIKFSSRTLGYIELYIHTRTTKPCILLGHYIWRPARVSAPTKFISTLEGAVDKVKSHWSTQNNSDFKMIYFAEYPGGIKHWQWRNETSSFYTRLTFVIVIPDLRTFSMAHYQPKLL